MYGPISPTAVMIALHCRCPPRRRDHTCARMGGPSRAWAGLFQSPVAPWPARIAEQPGAAPVPAHRAKRSGAPAQQAGSAHRHAQLPRGHARLGYHLQESGWGCPRQRSCRGNDGMCDGGLNQTLHTTHQETRPIRQTGQGHGSVHDARTMTHTLVTTGWRQRPR